MIGAHMGSILTAFRQSAFPAPPGAKQVPHALTLHGDVRQDPYFWLRDPGYPDKIDQPDIIAHLNAENAYVETVLGKEESGLRAALFAEMKDRIKEDDTTVPYQEGGWWYQTRFTPGLQHPVFVRAKTRDMADAVVIVDQNELAQGKTYAAVRGLQANPSGRYIAYANDEDGSERLVIRIKDMQTGQLLPERITNGGSSLAFADDATLFYTVLSPDGLRPVKVLRHRLGSDAKDDVVVYDEPTGGYFVSLHRTLSGKFIQIDTGNNVSSDVRVIPTVDPTAALRIVAPRRQGVEYYATHQGDRFLIRSNDRHVNFRLLAAPDDAADDSQWTEIQPAADDVYLTGVFALRDWVVLSERFQGAERIRVLDRQGTAHSIAFPDAAFAVTLSSNADYAANTLRLGYSSLVRPATVFDYHLPDRRLETLKVQEIPSGYDADLYISERLLATARDGTQVPVSLVRHRDTPLDGSAPLHLYGYGAYGLGTDPAFRAGRLSLLDRGFVFAIAHVRGGDEMGRQWWLNGKLAYKINSFTDFIDVAQHLLKIGYARTGNISMQGGSAGGLLMGAVLNMAPDGLFRAAVAQVPFVDVVTTMLDTSLPLTVGEFDEWGNPSADSGVYRRIKAYSPYDNVSARPYPHLLITAGLNDPRVTYWEPAKWAAKLRATKTGDHVLLSYTNMGAGHGGASGRYDALKEAAMATAFLLRAFDRVH